MPALAVLVALLAAQAAALAAGPILDRLTGARPDDWATPTPQERHARRSR